MLNEGDVTVQWWRLFRGQEVTSLRLEKAEALMDELSLESPLRVRLAMELEEIRQLHQKS